MFWGKTAKTHNRIERAIKQSEELWGDYSEVEELLILDAEEKRKMIYKAPIPKKANPMYVYFPSDIEIGDPHWKTAKPILKVDITEKPR